MAVIDLRASRTPSQGAQSARTASLDIHPERDLLRTAAAVHPGLPVAALDAFLAALGAFLAVLTIPWMTADAAVGVVVAWFVALISTRRYGSLLRHGQVRGLRVIGSATLRLCAALAIVNALFPTAPAKGLLFATLAMAAFTAIGRLTVAERLARGANARHRLPVLVRGPIEDVQRFLSGVAADAADEYLVVGVQSTGGHVPGDPLDGIPLLSDTVDPVEGAVRSGARAVMLVGSQRDSADDLRRLVWRLEGHGIATHMVPIVADLAAPTAGTIRGAGLPVLSFQSRDMGAEVGASKVIVDKCLALAALVVLSPVILATAVAVKVSSPGPVLFRQVRVGRGGTEFVMIKFRTMYRDAEERRAALEAQNEHDSAVLFKVKDDPRITRVGYWLRKFSLDELPQLVNVLKGDMSLVGPRPPLPSEVANYQLDAHRRFRVRPGLTGLWQVSGRSDLDPQRSVHLDTHYVEQWSPAMDAKILARTPLVVLSGKGAY